MIGLSDVKSSGKLGHGLESLADDQPGNQHQTRHEKCQRRDRAKSIVACNLVADLGRLTDCDATSVVTRLDQKPPCSIVALDIVQSVGQVAQRPQIHRFRAASVQLLDDEPRVGIHDDFVQDVILKARVVGQDRNLIKNCVL
jgi:hypothetical protein